VSRSFVIHILQYIRKVRDIYIYSAYYGNWKNLGECRLLKNPCWSWNIFKLNYMDFYNINWHLHLKSLHGKGRFWGLGSGSGPRRPDTNKSEYTTLGSRYLVAIAMLRIRPIFGYRLESATLLFVFTHNVYYLFIKVTPHSG
jgi:hypothetical protein